MTVVRAVRPTSGKPGSKALVRPTGAMIGWVGGGCSQAVVIAEALAAMKDGQPRLLRFSPEVDGNGTQEGFIEYSMECEGGGEMDIFVEPNRPGPQLLIVGDSDIAGAISLLGYRGALVAPGVTQEAFPEADLTITDLQRLKDLVTEDTHAVVASMGRYEETALRTLANSSVTYIGLVASRKRGQQTMDDMRRKGVPEESLARIRNPAGLDLAARTQ